MKAVLVNPISFMARNSRTYTRSVTPVPPLGMAYLATVLKKSGFEVWVEDQYATMIANEELALKIAHFKPDIVGFSCLTTAMSVVEDAVSKIKSHLPETTIILGNIHATLYPEQVLKKNVADIVVRGEGEKTLEELACAVRDGKPLEGIKGISYIENGRITHNPDREVLSNLDQLPWPDWDILDLSWYKSYPSMGIHDSLVLPVQASRGCHYNCYFCSQDRFYKQPRYRKMSRVVDEIEYLHKRFGVSCIGFDDAFFPFSIESGNEFCDEFIRRGLHKKIRWFTELRVDTPDFKLLKKMKRANVCLIMFGIESGTQRILDGMGKGTTLQQAREVVRYTRILNIRSMGLFILGLPGETRRTCLKTLKFARTLDLDICKFNLAVPYPGSRFFSEFAIDFDQVDRIKDKFSSWYDWSVYDGEIIYSPEEVTKKELIGLQRKGMLAFYARPQVIFRSLVKRNFSLIDMFYGAVLLIRRYLFKPRKA